jgi:hypothetical protein
MLIHSTIIACIDKQQIYSIITCCNINVFSFLGVIEKLLGMNRRYPLIQFFNFCVPHMRGDEPVKHLMNKEVGESCSCVSRTLMILTNHLRFLPPWKNPASPKAADARIRATLKVIYPLKKRMLRCSPHVHGDFILCNIGFNNR